MLETLFFVGTVTGVVGTVVGTARDRTGTVTGTVVFPKVFTGAAKHDRDMTLKKLSL